MFNTELTPRQALAQCGGDHLRSECAEYPIAAWFSSMAEGCLLPYWTWVCGQAINDGRSLGDLHQSEQSKQHQRVAKALLEQFHI